MLEEIYALIKNLEAYIGNDAKLYLSAGEKHITFCVVWYSQHLDKTVRISLTEIEFMESQNLIELLGREFLTAFESYKNNYDV